MDIDNRPTKRRRFFADDVEHDLSEPTSSTNNSNSAQTENSSRDERALSPAETADLQPENDLVSRDKFDVDTFCAFVGEQLDQDVVQRIQDASNGNMERAVNMYFDGSWRNSIPQRSHTQQNTIASFMSNSAPRSPKVPHIVNSEPAKPVVLKQMPQERYIGSFGVEGWSTKSGTHLIQAGETVKIERTRLAPRTKLGRGGKPVTVVSRNQKADVITRFLNEKGQEVGRLPEDAARWVSALLDQKICRLEGTCVFADEKLRVNDTVFLQIQVSMLRTAFDSANFIKPADDNRETGFFSEKESSEEHDLRMRQVALVKLFDEINLHPTSSNSTVAKHKKEGLLRAAEMAEQYEKDRKDKPKSTGDTPAMSDVEEEGDELEDDQLDTLYRKAQQFDFNMPEAQPASTFALSLRKYQRQALHWMLSKERDEKNDRQDSMHPLWEEYAWPTKDANDLPVPAIENQEKFYVNLYSGEISLEFPVQEQNCLGGILADEMGLGKTIEMLSLIHTHRSPEAVAASEKAVTSVNHLPRLAQSSMNIGPAPYTTLVVAPMSLLAQWESEATKSSKSGTMKTLVYYGSDKSINLQTLCGSASSAPNVIITSYGVVLSEFNQIASTSTDRGSHGGLFSIDFFRIILDEAHTIKNRQAKTSKACYELKGKHRWTLTGTPIVNRLEDLFSLVRFLKVEPWSNFSFWKTFITVPFEAKDFVRALNVVSTVLEPLVLRRTKDMKTPDGEALVPLPDKKIVIEEIELSKTERDVYDLIFHRAKRAFNESMAAGTLMKSYTTIFAQILRLRQSCCHPVLTRNKDIVADEEEAAAAAKASSEDNGLDDDMDLQELIDRFTADAKQAVSNTSEDPINMFSQNALRQIQTDSSGECPICSEEPMLKPVVTTCWHSACKNCLEGYISHQIDKGDKPRCPVCRVDINPRDIFEVIRFGTARDARSTITTKQEDDGQEEDDNNDEDEIEDEDLYGSGSPAPKISLRRLHPYSPTNSTSAKVAALLNHLTSLPLTTKSVVFSQFTSFLDLISPQLTRHNIPHLRFDGSMTQKLRASVLRDFTAENSSPSAPRVLLLSLRAGGVGLNLTAASRCYMMDPWWAYAVEAQAIDRVHRMGQTKNVEVVRFVVKDSIEGRMLKVQERKMAVAGTLGVGHGGGGGGGSLEDLKELLG